jgi:hypothetical protein
MIDKILYTLAFVVAGLEDASTSTSAFDIANESATSITDKLPLTPGPWTKAFLVSHYFVLYFVQELLPDNASELVAQAKDRLAELATSAYNSLQSKISDNGDVVVYDLETKSEYVTLARAAELLDVSLWTVSKAIDSGRLTVRPGSQSEVSVMSVIELGNVLYGSEDTLVKYVETEAKADD